MYVRKIYMMLLKLYSTNLNRTNMLWNIYAI
jgi:hypothetical protein